MATNKKSPAPITERQKEKRLSIIHQQRDAMERLFKGIGAKKEGEEDKEERPEINSGRRYSQRGANWKGRKKSVVIRQLQKEKLAMLNYLDKLQQPLKDEVLLHE